MPSKVFLFLVIGLISAAGSGNTPSESSQYGMILSNLKVPIFRQNGNSKATKTNGFLELKKGQFIRVDIDDGVNRWVTLDSNAKEKEYAVIPNQLEIYGTAQNGRPFKINRSTFLNIGKSLNGDDPTVIKNWDPARKEILQTKTVVYFDSKPGRRLNLTKKPMEKNVKCDDKAPGGNPCVGWPSTGDDLNIVEARPQYVFNSLNDQYESKLFYKVKTTYCPRKDYACTHEQLLTTEGWVQADQVGTVKRPPVPGVIRDDSPTCLSSLERNALIGSKAAQEAENEAYTNVGQCVGRDYVKKYTEVFNDVKKKGESKPEGYTKSWFNEETTAQIKALGKDHFGPIGSGPTPYNALIKEAHRQIPSMKQRESSVTNQQLEAIDSLARTLYGEVRGCVAESDGYAKAVAKVILNRAAYIKANGAPKYTNWVSDENPGHPKDPVNKLLIEVVGNDRQFSIYNRDDTNLKHVICPETYTHAWRTSVDVAYQVVMNRERFLKETQNITQTFYYSKMDPPPFDNKKEPFIGGTPQTKFKIGTQTLGVDPDDGQTPLSPTEACVTLFNTKFDAKIKDLQSKQNMFM